jgi:hypothetical protein
MKVFGHAHPDAPSVVGSRACTPAKLPGLFSAHAVIKAAGRALVEFAKRGETHA